MEIKSNFVRVFGDTPINRLWDFLIDSRGLFDYSMTEVCESADISWNTLKEIFPQFVKEGIVRETRKIGRARMYMLNDKHPKAVFMTGLQRAINMVFVRGGQFELKMEVIRNKISTPVRLDVQDSALKPVVPA